MIFRQLFDSTSCTYTYLIASRSGAEALLIDPVIEKTDDYVALVRELGLKLVLSMDTHVHADHVTATGKLAMETGCRTGIGDMAKVECIDVRFKDNELIDVDGLTLKTLYTPGHTDDSYSYLLDDKVFTGDTLLIRGTGRTDFQSGDSHTQYDSLFNRLLKLPESTAVYPAHDYKGWTSSSIGEEKAFNPRLQVNSPAEYAEIMDNLNLPRPQLIDIAVPANLKCGLV